MSDVLLVWVNCASEDEATRIAANALESRLAASSNMLSPVRSHYRWHGRIETATEVPLVLRTHSSKFDALVRLIKTLHSYETPSIVGLEAGRCDGAYRDWVARETRSESG